jgi:hypothetical protein
MRGETIMLTIKDIEELGFIMGPHDIGFKRDRLLIAAANLVAGRSDYIQIWINVPNKTDLLVFQGCVRSKEELTLLLEMVDTRYAQIEGTSSIGSKTRMDS